MKKAAILLCVLALTMTGCQNTELEKCRAENAKLKEENAKLSYRLDEYIKLSNIMMEEIDEKE